MDIDLSALDRVLGEDVAARLGHMIMNAPEETYDDSHGPALLCMAFELSAATGVTMGEAMTELLDAWSGQ